MLFWGCRVRGPVAQLGARFHGMEEVVSSNLTRSTKFLKIAPLLPIQLDDPPGRLIFFRRVLLELL
jgi:hypothetical protein